jgi:hypothetical protein
VVPGPSDQLVFIISNPPPLKIQDYVSAKQQ